MDKHSETIDLLFEDARNLMDQEYFEEAILKLQKGLRLETKPKKRAAILKELGYCYLRLGWYEDAVKVYKPLSEAYPHDADMRFFLSSAYASLKWTDEAIAELRTILKSDPTDVLARHDLALCFRNKGWLKESLEEMRRANTYAMLYGETDEKKIVESSLSHLDDETENGDGEKRSTLLLFLLWAMSNKRRMFRLRKRPRA